MRDISADLDEIVFRHRNKEYGAYEIRKKYPRSTTIAFFIGLSFLLTMVFLPYIISWVKGMVPEDKVEQIDAVADLMAPPPIDEKNQPEEIKEPPPPPPKRAEVQFTMFKTVKHEEAPPEETVKKVEELDTMKTDIGKANVEGNNEAPPEIKVEENTGPAVIAEEKKPEPEPDPDPNKFYADVQQPKPANMADIALEFPQILKDAGQEGTVSVKILVGPDGRPVAGKVLVLRSSHPLFTEEVMKHIPKLVFTPGIQAGRPTKAWVSLPFRFKLK